MLSKSWMIVPILLLPLIYLKLKRLYRNSAYGSKFELMLELSEVLFFDFNLLTGYALTNLNKNGVEHSALVKKKIKIKDLVCLIHKDDRKHVFKHIREILRGNLDSSLQRRVAHPAASPHGAGQPPAIRSALPKQKNICRARPPGFPAILPPMEAASLQHGEIEN